MFVCLFSFTSIFCFCPPTFYHEVYRNRYRCRLVLNYSLLILNTFKILYTFYSPPHLIHLWCYILHIYLYHLNIACKYNWFYALCLLTFVLAFLTGWSTVFIAYLLLLMRFYSKCILSHIMTFSFSIKGDPLTFLVRPVQWCWIFLVFAYPGKSFSFHQFWIITLPKNTYGTLLLVVILFPFTL